MTDSPQDCTPIGIVVQNSKQLKLPDPMTPTWAGPTGYQPAGSKEEEDRIFTALLATNNHLSARQITQTPASLETSTRITGNINEISNVLGWNNQQREAFLAGFLQHYDLKVENGKYIPDPDEKKPQSGIFVPSQALPQQAKPSKPLCER